MLKLESLLFFSFFVLSGNSLLCVLDQVSLGSIEEGLSSACLSSNFDLPYFVMCPVPETLSLA